MFEAVGVGISDTGLERVRNEDRYHLDDGRGLYVVCDGMGGHRGGDRAAEQTVASIVTGVADRATVLDQVKRGLQPPQLAEQELLAILQQTNRELYAQGQTVPEPVRPGTTAAVLLMAGDHAVVAEVGDSRVYHWRDGDARLLTHDDTIAQALVDEGTVASRDAVSGRFDHVLTQAIGVKGDVEVETHRVPVAAGDRFLLCSDGLKPHLEGAGDLGRRLAGTLAELPQDLVRLAIEAGSRDNITVVAVSVTKSSASAQPSRGKNADQPREGDSFGGAERGGLTSGIPGYSSRM